MEWEVPDTKSVIISKFQVRIGALKKKKTMSGRGKKTTNVRRTPKELVGERVEEVQKVKITFVVDKTRRCNAPSKSVDETTT